MLITRACHRQVTQERKDHDVRKETCQNDKLNNILNNTNPRTTKQRDRSSRTE